MARAQPTGPTYRWPSYRSTILRAPRAPLVVLPRGATEGYGPLFGYLSCADSDADLTRQHDGEPIGERIIVSGRVTDGDGRPVVGQLVEIWQANASGRYVDPADRHSAPLDPSFTGAGRCLTGSAGTYRFLTIKPGSYPWGNHDNAWRPAHIHFSVFGRTFTERLVTQMYFPGDPLLAHDPIFQSILDPVARERLVASWELSLTEPQWALGYRFDIVIDGHLATPMEG